MPSPIRVVLVMGVAGSGKTTVGRALAARLATTTGAAGAGWTFADADAYHAPAALAQMARGEALTDADRAPWLARLSALVREALAVGPPLVLACSALRAAYRDALTQGDPRVAVVWLDAPPGVLTARLAARLDAGTGNPVGPDLLPSQLAALEPPAGALRLVATQPVEVLVGAAETFVRGV